MKTARSDGKPGLAGVTAFLQTWDPGKGKAERHAPKVFALLKSGATARQVAEVLGSLREADPASPPPAPKDTRTAVRLVSWYRRTR